MGESINVDVAASRPAALSIRESLLLAMGALELMNEKELVGVVADERRPTATLANSLGV